MNFKEELKTMSENYNSEKLENVKRILMKHASDGKKEAVIDSHYYDKWVVNWLTCQGLDVKETFDQRDGDFIRVKW